MPTLVDSHGDFISYDIINSRQRTRRDLSQTTNDSDSNIDLHHNNMHYKLPLFDKADDVTLDDIHLNLTLNSKLISRNFKVEYLNRTGVYESHRRIDDCHYHGHIIGHHKSRVAISNCNGLVSNF